ncbi:MAG: hypothetical protein EAZ73_17920 [Oscillatoriales cyanobacterium]|nr:MAG: hypothetical protein EAZ73_17920 [Oscillatoriales cyanobacterium]
MILSLCAWEFLRQFEKQKTIELDGLIQIFREHWRDESWHEVLRLMAGMLDAKFTGEILEYLIDENGEAENFSNLFLAAECVSEVKNRNDIAAIASKLRERVKELTKYENSSASTPQEYDNLVYEIRRQAVAAVAATWKDDHETSPWLKQIAKSDNNWTVRQAAIQELARGWKDDPETSPWLKQIAKFDNNWTVRQAAIQELARGWKDDPKTSPWLKQIAKSDNDWIVRQAAVQELARGWKDNPETLSWLKQIAQSDDDRNVRKIAVQELARGWKDDPETLSWLKQIAQSDDDEDVRQAAVQELARGWKDEPETSPWLKQRAQFDDDKYVRCAAVQELAHGWKDDPDILPILKQRAQFDDDKYVRCAVRCAAVQELAHGWCKEDSEIFELLCDIAINDPVYRDYDWQISPRQTALADIIELYPDRPQTLELVRDLAQNDRDQNLREFAQKKLAELERK